MAIDPMGPVVVGIDGSECSLHALDLAAEEAAARLTPLVIVHAHGRGSGTRPTAPRLAGSGVRTEPAGSGGLTEQHSLLENAVTRALSEHPGLAVSAKLLIGDPAEVLLAQSRTARLVVVGHRQECGFPALPAGSVAMRVAFEAACPVVVHRPVDIERDTGQVRPVLVGVDGRPDSETVVEFAFEAAALRGAPLCGMHVWTDADSTGGHDQLRAPTPQVATLLATALAGWAAKYPDVRVSGEPRSGTDVARELTRGSHDAQLVVVGAGRPGAPARGLVNQTMIDIAGCPVAVVPLG